MMNNDQHAPPVPSRPIHRVIYSTQLLPTFASAHYSGPDNAIGLVVAQCELSGYVKFGCLLAQLAEFYL